MGFGKETHLIAESILNVLAFLFRSTALIALILLYRYFTQSSGTLVLQIRYVFAAFMFLFFWVWVASFGTLLMWWPQAGFLVERGTSWIWIPNAVVSAALAYLLLRLYQGDSADGK